jgi:AbrB family looped-hinge helix DNA binding protein
MKTLTFDYDELIEELEDGSSLMTIPEEVCKMVGLNPGDTVILTVEDDKLYIRKKHGEE